MKLSNSFIIIIFISFFSCKKEASEPNKLPIYEINSNLYPYLFKRGSYWVYSRESNGSTDSVYVNYIVKKTVQMGASGPGQGPNGVMEYFKINYKSSWSNQYYDEYLIGYLITVNLEPGGNLFLSGKSIGEINYNAEIVDVLDSLTVENELYTEVTKMKVVADENIPQNYFLYYSDYVGLIKKELIQNDTIAETWNLVNYHTEFADPN